jgi:predicted dehydrogenase
MKRKRKLRMGMVGGGRGAFIGAVHRMAATLDGQIELVCGAFSSDPVTSLRSGDDLFLPAPRCYGTYQELFSREAALPPGERMDFVTIVTPNALHFPVAKMAIEHGFDVVCDKPMTLDLKQARQLEKLVHRSGCLFALTHNYSGYPMVKEARERIRSGALGKIRRVVVEYPQGWLSSPIEQTGQKQADWRTDPSRAGISCCMGDIGTHAAHLADYVSGLSIDSVYADLSTFVRGRKLDDDGSVLLRFKGGAKGVLWASQIAVGEENGLHIRVYGEKGGLSWSQEEPNSLVLMGPDRPREIIRAGTDCLSPAASAACRLPSGHPEGFLEAFANLYKNFAAVLRKKMETGKTPAALIDYPGVTEGVRGMAFIEAVVASSKNGKWMKL